MARMVPSQRFRHPRLGVVHVVARANARRFIAAWKGAELMLTIPHGVSVAEVNEALESMTSKLLASRPQIDCFFPGWEYETPETLIRIELNSREGYFRVDPQKDKLIILIPDSESGSKTEIIKLVNKTIDRYAEINAEWLLFPQAREISARLNVKPAEWAIGRGQNRRGSCSASGKITLSRNLVFFPLELREYVICHELAHLTHFDHSPAFHRLLDTYLGGREAELSKACDAHRLPFIR